MQDNYRDRWCQFFAALLASGTSTSVKYHASIADQALDELKERDAKKAFDEAEKGYRG